MIKQRTASHVKFSVGNEQAGAGEFILFFLYLYVCSGTSGLTSFSFSAGGEKHRCAEKDRSTINISQPKIKNRCVTSCLERVPHIHRCTCDEKRRGSEAKELGDVVVDAQLPTR